MMMNATPFSAMSGIIAASPRPPVTSFTIEAPASMAARATSAFDVSIEMTIWVERSPGRSVAKRGWALLSPVNLSITGITRPISSSAPIGSAPGRVDSPPMSMMSAPSATSSSPCSTAFSGVKYSPPSENESSVTLSTPMIHPCRARSTVRPPIFQSVSRITR